MLGDPGLSYRKQIQYTNMVDVYVQYSSFGTSFRDFREAFINIVYKQKRLILYREMINKITFSVVLLYLVLVFHKTLVHGTDRF